jgi:hypothetical protein
MEACRVKWAQQTFKFQSADARRAQGADRVEHHIPGSGAAAFHDPQVFKADGVQFEENQYIVVRFAQFVALPERVRDGGGEFGMARRQGGRE